MGQLIPFPGRGALSWPTIVKSKRQNPTKRRAGILKRSASTYLDVYAGDVLLGMVSIDGSSRVLAWSEDWSTILEQPDVGTAVDAIRSGRVRNGA